MEMGLLSRVECSGTDAGCADTHWNDPLAACVEVSVKQTLWILCGVSPSLQRM